MNIEKYTERARGFIQSAQSLAMRDGHQQFSPLHLLKVLLDDSEGLAGGLDRGSYGVWAAGLHHRAILDVADIGGHVPALVRSIEAQAQVTPRPRALFGGGETVVVNILVGLEMRARLQLPAAATGQHPPVPETEARRHCR